jgi:hypothetical protein
MVLHYVHVQLIPRGDECVKHFSDENIEKKENSSYRASPQRFPNGLLLLSFGTFLLHQICLYPHAIMIPL